MFEASGASKQKMPESDFTIIFVWSWQEKDDLSGFFLFLFFFFTFDREDK